MRNSSKIIAEAGAAVALLGCSLVAQDDDGHLLELIRSAPKMNLERTEFMFAPRILTTSSTAQRAVSCVAVDRRGYVYAIQRGVPNPVIVADPSGKVVTSWGNGLFKIPHAVRIDPEGNVWTVDAESSIVYKFTPAGRRLLEINVGGQPASDPPRRRPPGPGPPLVGHFWGATDVAFGAGGHVFVSDGYANNRILEYDATGRRVKEWGTKGRGPGEFDLPHAIAAAPNGDLYIADRENGRSQWLKSDGAYQGKWDIGGRLFSVAVGRENELYFTVGAKQALGYAEGWLVRMDLKSGRLLGYIEAPTHLLSIAPDGTLFVGAGDGTVQRYRPR